MSLIQGGPSPTAISRQIPTDGKLKAISHKIHKRDWQLVANKLGLTSHDIQQVINTVGNDSYGQVLPPHFIEKKESHLNICCY